MSVKRLIGPQGYLILTEGLEALKISSTGNRNRDIASCGSVPKPNVPIFAPLYMNIK
jgi:hypothetical protein